MSSNNDNASHTCEEAMQLMSDVCINDSKRHYSQARSGYLQWPDYFMAIAFLSAMRSKDPSSQVGACVVNTEKKVVGIGYNGMPNGCPDNLMPWARTADNELDTKYPYVCHAELNAILNKNSADVKHCMLYVALFPCNECAKIIIQSGISEIVFISDKYHDKPSMIASRRLLDMAKVKYRRMIPTQQKIEINFSLKGGLSPVTKNETIGTANENTTSTGDSERMLSQARSDYLEWPEYFMAIAFLSALRSKDPVTQVGACVVNTEKKIVGIGYNGMPNGCADHLMPWAKYAEDALETKYSYVCHAELNAILNKNSADVKHCTLYVALFPCNECAKIIIQSGIRDVVYVSDKSHDKPDRVASRRLLDQASVPYSQMRPTRASIIIDFSVIDG